MNDRMDEYLDKRTLLVLIHTERVELERAVNALSEAQLTQPGILGEWSVKDILSHIIFWEQRMLNRFRTGQGLPVPEGMTVPQFIDYLNEQNYRATRDKPLAQVLDEFRDSHRQVLEFLATLTDDDLNDPERYEWWRGEPVWHYIRGDTYEHYREHSEPIRAWHEQV